MFRIRAIVSRRLAVAGSVVLIGTIAAGAVAAITTTGRPATPPRSIGTAAAASSTAAPVSDAVAQADADNCVATSKLLQALADTIAAAGGPHGAAVDTALARARAALSGPLTTTDVGLHRAFTDLAGGLRTLQAAVEANHGTGPATDDLLRRIDEIDTTCRTVLLAPVGILPSSTSG